MLLVFSLEFPELWWNKVLVLHSLAAITIITFKLICCLKHCMKYSPDTKLFTYRIKHERWVAVILYKYIYLKCFKEDNDFKKTYCV